MDNQEISNITKILGIEPKKDYKSVKQMRYGKLMIMADQDYDGSHIKGLIINLVQHWWPSLFQLPGFLPEYESWKEANNQGRGWQTKYYKGLGTSTTQEAKQYFTQMKQHSLEFTKGGEDEELLDMAFNKKRAN